MNNLFFINPLDDPNTRKNIYKLIVNSLANDRESLKKVKRFFDDVEFEILRHYCKRSRILDSRITSNYVVINLRRRRSIVVGYDRSRAKLFVNVFNDNIQLDKAIDDVEFEKRLRQYVFNYDVDVDQDEYVVSTDQVTSYRVQGDLVVVASPMRADDFLSAYADMIVRSIEFYRSYSNYVLFKLHVLLSSLRVFHEVDLDRRSIIIPRTLYKYSRSFKSNYEKLVNTLREILCDHLGDLCKTLGYRDWVSDGWGNNYKRLEIVIVNVNYSSDLVENIRELIKSSVKPDHYVVYHGNHRIEVDQALPRSIRVVYDDHEFVGSINNIFVDQNTVITITHDQHGKVVLKFDRPYVLELRSTGSSWDQDLIFTMYNLKHLLEKRNNAF